MTDILIWWFIITSKYPQYFPWDKVEANGKSPWRSRQEEACIKKRSEKTIKNSPGTSSQRRVWELIRRRKADDSVFWHFFQGQEYQLCQLQNRQTVHLSSPSLHVKVWIRGDLSTCSHVLPSSRFFFSYMHLLLCSLSVIWNWRSSETYQLIHPVCWSLQKIVMVVCDPAQLYGNNWSGTYPETMSTSW